MTFISTIHCVSIVTMVCDHAARLCYTYLAYLFQLSINQGQSLSLGLLMYSTSFMGGTFEIEIIIVIIIIIVLVLVVVVVVVVVMVVVVVVVVVMVVVVLVVVAVIVVVFVFLVFFL